jgi:hypothetical protein
LNRAAQSIPEDEEDGKFGADRHAISAEEVRRRRERGLLRLASESDPEQATRLLAQADPNERHQYDKAKTGQRRLDILNMIEERLRTDARWEAEAEGKRKWKAQYRLAHPDADAWTVEDAYRQQSRA